MKENAYIQLNYSRVGLPLVIDTELCTGCNSCVEVCRGHLLLPNPDKEQPPGLFYPEECWSCGSCVAACPVKAITLRNALSQRIGWKRKATGEYFRIGMKNPPSPNTRPPAY